MSLGVQLCNSYAKSPEDLAFKWQSICINMHSGQAGSSLDPLDIAGIVLLRRELQKEVQQTAQAKKAGAVNAAKRSHVRTGPRQSLPQAIRQPLVSVKQENRPIKIHDNLKDRDCKYLQLSVASTKLSTDRYMHERLAERATGM
jgi:hypothetical protein